MRSIVLIIILLIGIGLTINWFDDREAPVLKINHDYARTVNNKEKTISSRGESISISTSELEENSNLLNNINTEFLDPDNMNYVSDSQEEVNIGAYIDPEADFITASSQNKKEETHNIGPNIEVSEFLSYANSLSSDEVIQIGEDIDIDTYLTSQYKSDTDIIQLGESLPVPDDEQ